MRFLHGFGGPQVPYGPAWALQRQLHAALAGGAVEDTVILLEHEPVFTAGKRTEPQDRPWDAAATSVSRELGRTVTVSEVVPLVERRLAAVFGADAVAHAPLELPTAAVTTSECALDDAAIDPQRCSRRR
jgi:lipoate-protein ligase B